MNKKVIIGTRGSDLALWQANFIKSELLRIGLDPEIKIIKTQGDQIQNLSFDKLEGKGFFTKELEECLLAGTIDLAVHSFKDLPTTSPEGLIIAALSDREDPSELLLVNKNALDGSQKFNLKQGAVVGTSSPRRKSQMLAFRPDIQLKDLRGNVPTRIDKLRSGAYDAILLAKAGVERLKLDIRDLHADTLSPLEFIPAPAQGVLALQIRESNHELHQVLQKDLHNASVEDTVSIERKILNLSDGGCQLPLGAYCIKKGGNYLVWTSKADAWDKVPVRILVESPFKDNLPDKVIAKLSQVHPVKVFISRDLEKDSYFNRVLTASGYSVSGMSLIETETIRFSNAPKTDWIFFSSSNAVIHFFKQQPEISIQTKFGVIGKGTEAVLKKHGYKASFTGESSDVVQTGIDFSGVVAGQSILFPKAAESMRTIQKQMSENTQAVDCDVYRTKPRLNVAIPTVEVIVFTSPSNVKSFLKNSKLDANHKVIAIGKSTAICLEENGIKNYKTAYTPDEPGLAEAVFSL